MKKVPASIRNLYDDYVEKYNPLGKVIDTMISAFKIKEWHFFDRIKSLDSFALKFECGRINPNYLCEYFYACTLVVRNISDIKTVLKNIDTYFDIKLRRPKIDSFKHKSSEAFPFCDLRLYCVLRATPDLPTSEINNLIFEYR